MNVKHQFLELIRSNIDKYGYHIYIVSSITEPRYAYTIGLSHLIGFEIVFAGGINYLKDDLLLIFDTIVEKLKKERGLNSRKITVGNLGVFSLGSVDASWCELMLLGVFDYFKVSNVNAFQIIPDSTYHSLDIPDMSKEWNATAQPVWQWLVGEWSYSVPKNSTVITNLDALFGQAITEVTRWEDNEWEMFAGAGPDVKKDDIRVISLGTILGIDKTLLPIIDLDVGKGLWRNSVGSNWNNWE